LRPDNKTSCVKSGLFTIIQVLKLSSGFGIFSAAGKKIGLHVFPLKVGLRDLISFFVRIVVFGVIYGIKALERKVLFPFTLHIFARCFNS
jgi:hypothetical protein